MMLRQKGFSLVELMIALLLSSIIIAAIANVFLDSGKSSRKQKALSYLVQDGRIAVELLVKEFRRIGFLRNPYMVYVPGNPSNMAGGPATDIFETDSNVFSSGLTLGVEEHIKGDFSHAGFAGDIFDNNRLLLRYQLDAMNDLGASPCTKNISLSVDPAARNMVVTLYYYVRFDNTTTNSPVLYCEAKLENIDDSTTLTSAAIPLVSNVEKWHILYGEDITGDGFANRYLLANQVTAAGVWKNIKSVRFYLVLGSESKYMTQTTPSYRIDGRDYSVNTPNDKRLYKVFTSTVAFRNKPV